MHEGEGDVALGVRQGQVEVRGFAYAVECAWQVAGPAVVAGTVEQGLAQQPRRLQPRAHLERPFRGTPGLCVLADRAEQPVPGHQSPDERDGWPQPSWIARAAATRSRPPAGSPDQLRTRAARSYVTAASASCLSRTASRAWVDTARAAPTSTKSSASIAACRASCSRTGGSPAASRSGGHSSRARSHWWPASATANRSAASRPATSRHSKLLLRVTGLPPVLADLGGRSGGIPRQGFGQPRVEDH